MYNEELELLIEAALADGELTEKEKQILFKKAQSFGIDLDEFEMVLDARLLKKKKEEQSISIVNDSEKHRNLYETNRSVTELTNRINAIYAECEQKKENGGYKASGFLKSLDSNENEDERFQEDLTKKVKIAIELFPIPNSKEELLDLLQYIQPKVQTPDRKDPNTNVWKQKYIEILNRAKFSFANDSNMLNLLASFEEATKPKNVIGNFTRFLKKS